MIEKTKLKRLSIDEYFMEIASVVAKRSTCLRKQVGAVVVLNKRILSTGYNGAPKHLDHCLDIGCLREDNNIKSGERHELCRGVHAEQNAIIQAALHGVSMEGSTIYTTHQPCILCAKMLINSGIKRVVFCKSYPDQASLDFFKKANIVVERKGE